jgi:molybdate transport system substrate-binding protein
MGTGITGISSMATRQILAALARRYEDKTGTPIAIKPMGGVDAAKRVRAGEEMDIVVLAGNVMAKLEEEGHILAGSVAPFARSGMAIAVRAGAPHPRIDSEDAVRRAVSAAGRIGYSTGPSGDHVLKLAERWEILPGGADRFVKAPPGVPVGSLVAKGEVELGFQQFSELLHEPGIEVAGPLPPEIQNVTVFAAGIARTSLQSDETRALIRFLVSAEAEDAKRAQGMEGA